MSVADRAKLACAAADLAQALVKQWGEGVGLPLLCAYYSGAGPLTAAEIGELAGLSEDTARRKLQVLKSIGRVNATATRPVRYAPSERHAEKSIKLIEKFVETATCG
ncbi:helix-turn-helix domain-containing protein [Novosphingobium lindaniclasticum]|uniref:hypothetical protein n=1 Tax=Novosphingobium lindaniclasticum TaxID=1329895 RepID=UPI0012686A1C|nr:hypothetical protein [Novosphingobium lindaniclasticum]